MWRMITFSRTIIASCLIVLLLISGCGKEYPKAPLGSDQNATQSRLGKKFRNSTSSVISSKQVKRKKALDQAALRCNASQSIVPSSGGGVKLYDFRINIPAGALSSNTSISIAPTCDTYLQSDFGPDGTQFQIPATLTISYEEADLTGIKPADLTISWFDPATNQWIDLGGTVDTKTKTVSVQVWHFTEYTLSTR